MPKKKTGYINYKRRNSPNKPPLLTDETLNTMKGILTNYKTTISGLISIIGGVGLILTMLTKDGGFSMETVSAGIGMITAGFGLIMARDGDVSSEKSGAK